MQLLADPEPALGARTAGQPDDWARFLRSFLSPDAYRLLLMMAVIPDFLSMGTIRAVQQRVMPCNGVAELAEVLLCGALEAPDSAFADGGGRLRFVSEEASSQLLAAVGPALQVSVWQALDSYLYWTGSAGLAQFLVEHPFGEPMSVVELTRPGERVTVTGPGRPPVPVPVVREVVSKLAVQSRAVAADLLAARQLDESGLRLIDAGDLIASPDDGLASLRDTWSDEGATAVHIDHADGLARHAEPLAVLTELVRNSVGRRGPRVVVLGRRGDRDEPERYPPLFSEPFAAAGARHRIDWELEETPALRVYRMLRGTLPGLLPAVEDHLWRGLRDSMFLPRLARDNFVGLVTILGAEISRRHAERARYDHEAPLNSTDLPLDIDAFLRSTL
jgi:hypothetical protein